MIFIDWIIKKLRLLLLFLRNLWTVLIPIFIMIPFFDCIVDINGG